MTDFGIDAFAEGDGQSPEHGQIGGAVITTEPAIIFTQMDIQLPMELILHMPVTTDHLGYFFRISARW